MMKKPILILVPVAMASLAITLIAMTPMITMANTNTGNAVNEEPATRHLASYMTHHFIDATSQDDDNAKNEQIPHNNDATTTTRNASALLNAIAEFDKTCHGNGITNADAKIEEKPLNEQPISPDTSVVPDEWKETVSDIDMTGGWSDVLTAGLSKLGSTYLYAHHGPDMFSCDGFTEYSYTSVGVRICDMLDASLYGQYAYLNANGWITSDIDALIPGSVLFYGSDTSNMTHAALYLGTRSDGTKMMMHSTSGVMQVVIQPLMYDNLLCGGAPGLATQE